MQYLAIERQKSAFVRRMRRWQSGRGELAASVAYGAGRTRAVYPAASVAYGTESGRGDSAASITYGSDRGVWRIRLRLLRMAQTERVRRAGCICCIWHRQKGRGELAASVVCGAGRAGAASWLRLLYAALAERAQRAGCVCCVWHRQNGCGDPGLLVMQ